MGDFGPPITDDDTWVLYVGEREQQTEYNEYPTFEKAYAVRRELEAAGTYVLMTRRPLGIKETK